MLPTIHQRTQVDLVREFLVTAILSLYDRPVIFLDLRGERVRHKILTFIAASVTRRGLGCCWLS